LNRPFRFLLAAKGIGALGSQVTIVALPLTAVLVLHATPFQMGLLSGASTLPGVLFGLVAGVAIDRLPKRQVLLVANALSAITMAAIPAAAYAKILSLPLLFILAFIAASIASVEGITFLSLMPDLVAPERLAGANARFAAVISSAFVAGPAAAGVLIAALTAPGAITAEAAGFVVAFVLLLALPSIPPATPPHGPAESLTSRLRAGFDFSIGHPTIRLFVTFAFALNFCGGGITALQALFIVRQLHVPPTWYGAALACGGAGAVAGALLSGPAGKRFNVNLLLAVVVFISLFTGGFICSLRGAPQHVAIGFAAAVAISGIGNGILGISIVTFLQKVTPLPILARVIGTLTTLVGASVPAGALAAGTLAGKIGLRPTLITETAGFALILAVVLLTAGRELFEPASSPPAGERQRA